MDTPQHGDPIQSEKTLEDFKTPPPHKQDLNDKARNSSGEDHRKPCTPDRLSVPKAFKFPERYRSPTDLIMSPISKGLARGRKGALLPPSKDHPKIQDISVL